VLDAMVRMYDAHATWEDTVVFQTWKKSQPQSRLDELAEACEAYIRSQAGEGWRLVPEHYDDCGLSGAPLDRLALQALLAGVRASRIDVVVV
jgi:site-specific DNA recombinase